MRSAAVVLGFVGPVLRCWAMAFNALGACCTVSCEAKVAVERVLSIPGHEGIEVPDIRFGTSTFTTFPAWVKPENRPFCVVPRTPKKARRRTPNMGRVVAHLVSMRASGPSPAAAAREAAAVHRPLPLPCIVRLLSPAEVEEVSANISPPRPKPLSTPPPPPSPPAPESPEPEITQFPRHRRPVRRPVPLPFPPVAPLKPSPSEVVAKETLEELKAERVKLSKPSPRNFTSRVAFEAAKAAYKAAYAAEWAAYLAYLAARPLWEQLPAMFEGGYLSVDPRSWVRRAKEHPVATCQRRHRDIDHPEQIEVRGTPIREKMDRDAVGKLRRKKKIPEGGLKNPKVIPACKEWVNSLVLRPAPPESRR